MNFLKIVLVLQSFSLSCRMDEFPESRTHVKCGEDPPKEPGILPTHPQDVLDCSAALVDPGLSVMSDSSPSSVGPSGSVLGPMTTLVQDSQPHQVFSGSSLQTLPQLDVQAAHPASSADDEVSTNKTLSSYNPALGRIFRRQFLSKDLNTLPGVSLA